MVNNYMKSVIESNVFRNFIVTLIIMNGIILGLDTNPQLSDLMGDNLRFLDQVILYIFGFEIAIRISVHKTKFFKDHWNLFDTLIVCVAFLPSNHVFSILRVARIFRVFRLISAFPQLRRVVEGLVRSLPGVGSIGVIIVINMYTFSVMATNLYGKTFPQWFGTIEASIFTLFQIMTLEGWPDIVRGIIAVHPFAWVFFVFYIMISTFCILNLFIAVIVNAMENDYEKVDEEKNISLKDLQKEIVDVKRSLNQLIQIKSNDKALDP